MCSYRVHDIVVGCCWMALLLLRCCRSLRPTDGLLWPRAVPALINGTLKWYRVVVCALLLVRSFVRHLFIFYYYYYFHSTVVERVIYRTFSIHPQKQNFNNIYHPTTTLHIEWVAVVCGTVSCWGHNAPRTDPTQPLSVSSSIPYHSGNRSCDEDDDAVEGKEENGDYEA